MGFPVCVIDGTKENIKITVQEDLRLAEQIMKRGL
jgi:2-C-methyl-D-erythritol 4-phosphate cytidylyltransferase